MYLHSAVWWASSAKQLLLLINEQNAGVIEEKKTIKRSIKDYSSLLVKR